MTPEEVLAVVAQWEPVVGQLATLGVQTFDAIRALMSSAGVDADVIAALEPKWQALYDDVKRAAGEASSGLLDAPSQ